MMKHWGFRVIRAVALVYAGLVLLVALFQRRMIYMPTQGAEADLQKIAEKVDLKPWRSANGEWIGWRQAASKGTRRLVVFHGNAGQALDRDYYVDGFAAHGWEVFLLEYPGYGARSGSPSKDALIRTGRAAVEELLAADSRPVFLLGESIGSGPACAIGGQLPDRVAGLVLVVPFARLGEVAKAKMPFLPIGLILRDNFDNLGALADYRGRVAVVVAENDEIITAAQGLKLYAAYAGPKQLSELADCGHNDFPTNRSAPWWKEVSDFLAEKP